MADKKPNDGGKRLMAQVIDKVAQLDPGRKVCSMPKGSDISDGFFDLTFHDLAHAVNYMSWWIEKSIGRSSTYETLTYIGMNDIRYLVIVMACNKTGYKPLLSSTRNADEAHLHLLDATKCSKLAYSVERKERAVEIKNLRSTLELLEIPSLMDMLESETTVYPMSKSFEEVENDSAFIIHSSGTTGLPKPVYLTHGFLGAFENVGYLPVPTGRTTGMPHLLGSDDLIFATTPFFHLMGFALLVLSVFHGIPFVLSPDKPMSAELATQMLQATSPTAAVFPPSILEDMCNSSASMEALSHLKYIWFAGAPLSPDAGQRINERSRVVNFIGSSEAGFIASLLPEHKEDWQYFEWNPAYGIDMQPVGENFYEMVIPRQETRDNLSIFHTFPDCQEYHTNDLFIPHPTRPNLWKYYGRLDDVIVLSNGEKFNPTTMEKIIEGHPLVSRAVVVGQARFQSALLIEPSWCSWTEEEPVSVLIDQIWPTVQEANRAGPGHARIMKNKIGVSSRNKPFKVTPKGSTQRRHVLRDYEQEIDSIYADSVDEAGLELKADATLSDVKELVRDSVSRLLETEISDQVDFYAAGLDSLQTMQLSKLLQRAIPRQPGSDAISAQHIYANPTVGQLSRALYGIMSGTIENGVSRSEKIDTLLEKYTSDLPRQVLDARNTDDKHAIILTGSTGSLGNYILSTLLNDPKVTKVYCLNRSEARDRQIKSFQEKGLAFGPEAQSKVEFLQVSFGEERFGLDSTKYAEMLQTVDTVIHNAWRVDFNISVDSFEDVHIRGVRRFVDFSLQSVHHAHIHFVSSVSTIGSWNASHGPAVPETPLENCDVVLPQGYGESKHIAERLCLEASRRAGVPTTVFRVGQIAGPTTEMGVWNRQEWLPTIVATSKAIGKVPKALGSMPVDWVPVDTLAKIMVELVNTRRTTQASTRCAVFHLINPSTTSWESLLPAIQARYQVELVELSEWVEELERIENPSAEEVAAKPALKLLDFYRGLEGEGSLSAPIEVEKTKEASATMNSLGPISQELMANWLRQWAF